MVNIPILVEEPHFLVINKPVGLFSQAASGIDSVQSCLQTQLRDRDAHQGNPFIGLPHRLDRVTSGVMLIARNQRALKRFGQQFQSRKVGKYYLAVVEGRMESGVQSWEDRVRKVPDEPRAELVNGSTEGRPASLDCAPLAALENQTLLLIRLHTGRMHQIRIQAAERGFPIVGDKLYGAQTAFVNVESVASGEVGVPIALHALRLEFRHPQTGVVMAASASVPDLWYSLPEELTRVLTWLTAKSMSQARHNWRLDEIHWQDS